MITLFVSHSYSDGLEHATQLTQALAAPPNVDVWAPTRSMRLGSSWEEQARHAISKADAVILLMTPDVYAEGSACRFECIIAQEIGIPLILVRASKLVTLFPDFIYPWNIWIDMVTNPTEGIDRLRIEIGTMINQGRIEPPALPKAIWNARQEPIPGGAGIYVGRWFVSLQRTRRFIELNKDYIVHLHPNNRFWERLVSDKREMMKQAGMWSLNPDGVNLIFALSKGGFKQLTIDSSMGLNVFSGVLNETRFTARRMLELE